MIWDPWEQEDKSYSVSHILSEFPFLSASNNQLSWLTYANSCPNHWSPDMMKRGAEESGLCIWVKSTGLSGEERDPTVTTYQKFTTLFSTCFEQKRFISTAKGADSNPIFYWRINSLAFMVLILSGAVLHVNNFHPAKVSGEQSEDIFQCCVAPCRNVLFQSPWRRRQRF